MFPAGRFVLEQLEVVKAEIERQSLLDGIGKAQQLDLALILAPQVQRDKQLALRVGQQTTGQFLHGAEDGIG